MNQQSNSLNEIKERVIKDLASIDPTMSNIEKESYIANLTTTMEQRQLATTVRTQSGLTDANAYNKTAYEIYLDLLTVFKYVNDLDDTIYRHQQLNQSIINTLTSQINELNDKLDEIESVIGINTMPECFIDGFRTANNQENDKKYYQERYGEYIPKEAWAKFNQEQENLSLNYARQQNVISYKNDIRLGTIEITKQYGAGFIKAKNIEANINNAIDTSKSTYWAETILSPQEIKIKGMEYEDSEYMKKYNRSFYDLPRGAMCEICIKFESVTKVNELILNPFGNFPIDIIAIRYTLTDGEDDNCFDVLYPDNKNEPWLTSTTINEEHAFHFPDIKCKRLYILINQLHCIKNSYLISCNQMMKNELWFNATNDDLQDVKLDNSTIFAPLYLDRGKDDTVWKYINNKMITNKNLDFNDLLINNNNKTLSVTRYQYTYGFYNITPNYVEFQKTGIYVSKEIQVSGSIKTVSLTTEEDHLCSEQNDRQVTDIEYYITAKQNPEYSDWIPICPKNKNYIECELLQLDYDVCYLRHKAVCGIVDTITDKDGNIIPTMIRPIVRMNDTILTENADYILRTDENNNVVAIEILNIDMFAIYTVSYTPTDDSKEVNLILNDNPIPTNSFEIINGTGAACYELKKYPYYNQNNPDSTSTHVKISNIHTGTTIDDIKCVTNKMNPSESYKKFSKTSNGIQYYTNGKYIYFSRPISKSQKIAINYPCFESSIRLKAILRKNSKKDFWVTPILNKYKLEFTTIN